MENVSHRSNQIVAVRTDTNQNLGNPIKLRPVWTLMNVPQAPATKILFVLILTAATYATNARMASSATVKPASQATAQIQTVLRVRIKHVCRSEETNVCVLRALQ